ncbi:MAG TPA: sugar nucleotide-binding protein, partial [Candidatus Binatia bacterium]|nr:sugar nucleotide-binding protein [Candidatus Binatia bacterium]
MKKLALVGASGLVGTTLVDYLQQSYTLLPTCFSNPVPGFTKLDITNPDAYHAFLDAECPDIVIHAAALTDLERCEHHPDEAAHYNTKSLEVLLDHPAKIVYISTDGVFDGTKGNYVETDPTTPI